MKKPRWLNPSTKTKFGAGQAGRQHNGRVAKLVYAYDSKSYRGNSVWVRVPPRPQSKNNPSWDCFLVISPFWV